MNIHAELMYAMSCALRTCVVSCIAQGMGILLLCTLLGRKRSVWPLMLYVWVRFLVLLLFIEFRIWKQNADWVVLLNGTLGLCSTAGAILLSKHTFHGDLLKVTLAIMISEIVLEIIMVPSVLIINLLEGRSELLAMRGEFRWMDLLVLPIEGMTAFCIFTGLSPLLRKFRAHEIRHKKCLGVVAISYVILSQLLGLTDYASDKVFLAYTYVCMSLMEMALLLLAYGIVQKYQKDIRKQKEFLLHQQYQMNLYYQKIGKQTKRMEQDQQDVQTQMKKIIEDRTAVNQERKKQAEPVAVDFRREEAQERISMYLKELKTEYARLQAGMYCNDWLVDAVLCCQREAAEELGIEVGYFMQGYSRGIIDEEDLAQMVFYLLDFGIRENARQAIDGRKEIHFQAGAVKNQLVIDFYTTCQKGVKFQKTMLQEAVDKWYGTVTEIRNQQGMRAVITLQRTGKRREL